VGSIPDRFKIGICCFSTKYVALRRKSNDWLAGNQDIDIISLFTELVEQETKLTVKTKTKTNVTAAFERTVALKTQDPDKTILLLFLFLRIVLV
jgi:hypothetical protein